MKNRLLKNIFAFAAAAASVLACSGTQDDSSLPELSVSAQEIDLADGKDVEFTVRFNGQDVTDASEIFSDLSETDPLPSVFAPEKEGRYTFFAVYDGKRSNTVTVTVNDTRVKVESRYERHVCLIEFTGAWCLPCYSGFNNMMGTLSKPSMSKYKDRIHIAAFHSEEGGTDVMAIPATRDVFRLFKGLAYPSFAVDLRDSGLLSNDGVADLQPSLMSSFNDYPSHCGVAVSSVLNADRSKASVKVKVSSELTSEYRVILLVVEDKIKGVQKTDAYPDGQPDFIHKHVVRKVATTYRDTFTGEKITDDGRVAVGEEVTGSWDIDVDGAWKLEDTEIYALVLDADGYVNNMNVCEIDNGDSDYNIKD